MRPVIVHGGGGAISRAMAEAGLEPRFVQGRRYTDASVLAVVERVLAGRSIGGSSRKSTPLADAKWLNFQTRSVLFGEPLKLEDAAGADIDLGLVGRVTRRPRFDRGPLPPMGGPGHPVDVRTGGWPEGTSMPTRPPRRWPRALEADKLVFLSDVNGVRRDRNDPDSLVHSLTAAEAAR